MKYQVIKAFYNIRHYFYVGDVFEGTEKNGYVYLCLPVGTVYIPLDNVHKL
jgi:hypothetical protein